MLEPSGGKLSAVGQDPERDGEVKRRSLLGEFGGRQIDQEAEIRVSAYLHMFTALMLIASMAAGQTETVSVPPNMLTSLEYYVGDWTYEYEDEGVATKGEFSVAWAPGKHCAVANARETSKKESTSTVTISENGNMHTWTGSGKVGDKKTHDQHDVWRRVSR